MLTQGCTANRQWNWDANPGRAAPTKHVPEHDAALRGWPQGPSPQPLEEPDSSEGGGRAE